MNVWQIGLVTLCFAVPLLGLHAWLTRRSYANFIRRQIGREIRSYAQHAEKVSLKDILRLIEDR